MGKKPLSKKALVVKSNEINEAHYKLSANEQKLIMAMIAQIHQDDEDFKPYRIEIKELRALLGISTGDIYPMVIKLAEDLRARKLTFYDPGTDTSLHTGWLSASIYHHGKGFVELEFSPRLKPYLLQLRARYTAYQLKNIVQLKSAYSIRLFELLKQYQTIGSRSFELSDLRKILGLADNEYKFFNDFKKRVILTAQKELSEKTDIQFDFTEKKTGRAVTGLRFNIFSRLTEVPTDAIEVESTVLDEYDMAVSKLLGYEQDLFKRLQATYKLSKKQAHEVVTGYLSREGRDYVDALLTYCYGYWQKAVKVDSQAFIGAVTWAAIRDGWQIEKPLFPEPDKPQKKEPPPIDSEEDIAEVKKMLKAWKKEVFKDS